MKYLLYVILISLFMIFECSLKKTKIGFDDSSTPVEKSKSISKSVVTVSGQAVGHAAAPGPFYSIAENLIKSKDVETCNLLINDTSAVARLLGFYCLMNIDSLKYKSILTNYENDTIQVPFQPFRGIIQKESFGNIIKMIKNDPEFLGRFPITE